MRFLAWENYKKYSDTHKTYFQIYCTGFKYWHRFIWLDGSEGRNIFLEGVLEDMTKLAQENTLNIPLLCHAISWIVLPRTWIWSIPRGVIPVTIGLGTTFVLQFVPPIPTSRIVASTFLSKKTCNAMSVRNRKYCGMSGIAEFFLYRSGNYTKNASEATHFIVGNQFIPDLEEISSEFILRKWYAIDSNPFANSNQMWRSI